MPRSRTAFALALSLAIAAPAAGEVTRRAASDFHRRALVEGRVTPGEAHAIPLSLEAVAALKKGGELRLFDANGREIPSLVHAAVSRGEVVDRPSPLGRANGLFRHERLVRLGRETAGGQKNT